MLRTLLAIAWVFRWNRIHSGGTLSQSGTPEKLIGLRHFWESLLGAADNYISYNLKNQDKCYIM